MSQRPRLPGIARRQNDFIVADRHTVEEVTEAHSGQQRPSWNTLGLSPRPAVVVTQQDVSPLSYRHQPLVRRRNTEKKRTRGERRSFGKSAAAPGRAAGVSGSCAVDCGPVGGGQPGAMLVRQREDQPGAAAARCGRSSIGPLSSAAHWAGSRQACA